MISWQNIVANVIIVFLDVVDILPHLEIETTSANDRPLLHGAKFETIGTTSVSARLHLAATVVLYSTADHPHLFVNPVQHLAQPLVARRLLYMQAD